MMIEHSEESNEPQQSAESINKPNLELAFQRFLESGQPLISNNTESFQERTYQNPTSKIAIELRTAGYAIGLAALLLGAIFGGIELGAKFSSNSMDSKIQASVSDATEELKTEIETLQQRIEQLEKTNSSTKP